MIEAVDHIPVEASGSADVLDFPAWEKVKRFLSRKLKGDKKRKGKIENAFHD